MLYRDNTVVEKKIKVVRFIAKKIPFTFCEGDSKQGGDLLSHDAVPSALTGLTSLFGMGRGEPRRNGHLKPLPRESPGGQYLNIPEKKHTLKKT